VTAGKTVTFLDANVLIAAATGQGDVARQAFAILDDPGRVFVTSPLVRLEVLPKAIYHRRRQAVDFYNAFFESARSVDDMNLVLDRAFDQAVKHDIAPRDAMHIAAALAAFADEVVTAERPSKPMFRTTANTVRSLYTAPS
jgi:hypothetical protein